MYISYDLPIKKSHSIPATNPEEFLWGRLQTDMHIMWKRMINRILEIPHVSSERNHTLLVETLPASIRPECQLQLETHDEAVDFGKLGQVNHR